MMPRGDPFTKRFASRALTILIWILLFPSLATAADLTGIWTGTYLCQTHNWGSTLYAEFSQTGSVVTGTFRLSQYSPPVPEGGTGTLSGNTFSYEARGLSGGYDNFTFRVQATLSNNTLSGTFTILRDGANIFCMGTINATKSVVQPSLYTLTPTFTVGGTISPAQSIQVAAGSNECFKIIPEKGYKIQNVLVDGISVLSELTIEGGLHGYTFTNVNANHTISAVFQKEVNLGSILQILLD